MYPKKWENVLIEWVNCLKLAAPIKNLDELKDGTFFTNLLQLIVPVNSDTSKHIFQRIHEFLKEQYPYFSLNCDNDLNKNGPEHTDLIIISSLLLHYSCIHDRRDVLTSPLCHQLSKTTQTTIKVYLEKTANHISCDDFFNIIETTINLQKKKPALNCTLTCNYSNQDSPLQAFLHTPTSKVPRLREKDREINKLRTELDLERFEKIDLQKELTDQKERNKSLSRQLHNKTIETSKLNNEIFELESKFASNNCSNDWNEVQQRLRREITSSEQYISQLHSEQEKLYKEKDEIKEQVKKLQVDCNFWQDKALSFESNYEKLLEKHTQQEFEFDNLRRHCNELSGLLEELQSTKRVDRSYEEADNSVMDNIHKLFENTLPMEDLACAVVEVQLRDVQKENTELKTSLKECQENIVKLNTEVYNFKIKIKQLQGDKEILECENQDFKSKVTLHIKTREMLDKTKTQLENTTIKLQETLSHNEFLTSNVVIKDKQLLEAQANLQSLRNSNAVLANDLKILKEDYKNLQCNLKNCQEQLFTFQAECDSTSKCLTELKLILETILGKFEIFVFGSTKLDLREYEKTFTVIINELENDRIRQHKDKKSRLEDIARFEKLVAMQKTDIVALNEQKENHLNEIEKLRDVLKATKEEVSVLEETITSYVDKVKCLNGIISEKNVIEAELHICKVDLEQKIINLENTVQICNDNEALLKNTVLDLRRDIKQQSLDFNQHLEVLQSEASNLKDKVISLTSDLDEARAIIAQCKLHKVQLQNDIEEYIDKLRNLEIQHHEVNDSLRLTLTREKNLSEEFNTAKINHETEIFSLNDKLKICEEQLENVTSSETKLRQQIEENNSQIVVLSGVLVLTNMEMHKKLEEIECLKMEYESLSAKNMDLDKECLNLVRRCKELENNIRRNLNELSIKNEELNTIIIKNKDNQVTLETKIMSLEDELWRAKGSINLHEEKVNEYEKQVLDSNKKIDLFVTKEQEYVTELIEVKEELNATTSKYTEALQTHQEFQVESESQINSLTENLHELITKYNELDNSHRETIKQLNNVQNSLDKCKHRELELEEDIHLQQLKFEDERNNNSINFDTKIKELQEKQARKLKEATERLHFSEQSCEEIYISFQQLCVVVAHEKLHGEKLRKKVNYVYAVYKKLRNSFEELKRNVQLLSDNPQNLNNFKVELSHCLKVLIDDNSGLRKSNYDLEEKLDVLQNECYHFKQNLEKLHQKDEELNLFKEENKSQKEALNTLIKEKEELREEVFAEQKRFNNLSESIKNKVEDYELKLKEFKRINDTLIDDKRKLEEGIKEISSLEAATAKEILVLQGLVNSKDEEVKVLLSTIDNKKIEVEEVNMKNQDLELELTGMKESFNAIVQKLQDLEQVLEKEREEFAEKSGRLNENLSLAHREIENLKKNLKDIFSERQALELEINSANEKINEYESSVRKKESDIRVVNTKLLTKLEEITNLEKCKQALLVQVEELGDELNNAKKETVEIKELYEKLFKNAKTERAKLEEESVEERNILLKRIEVLQLEKDGVDQIQTLLEKEKLAKEILELRLSDITNENSKFTEYIVSLKNNIQDLIHTLSETPFEVPETDSTKEIGDADLISINADMGMLREKVLRIKEQNKLKTQQISVIEEEKVIIDNEKQKLLQDICAIKDEKTAVSNELQGLKDLQIAHEIIKAKYEQLKEHQKSIESSTLPSSQLQETIDHLKKQVSCIHNTCEKFAGLSTSFKTAIDKLITERSFVENVVNNLRHRLTLLQSKMLNVKDEREGLKLKEQIESFEFLVEDLQKQYIKISKKVNSVVLKVIGIPQQICDSILTEKFTVVGSLCESIDFQDELETISDFRNSANNLLDQISTFEVSLGPKLTKITKENVLKSSTNISLDTKGKEDLKKMNTILKQRLTLSENAKNNFEKKIKQLRQENKLLQEKSDSNMEISYKTLLQQHIELKEKLEKTEEHCANLLQEYETSQVKQKVVPDQIKYVKCVKSEPQNKLEKEIAKLRDAYGNAISDNSKLVLEKATMRKLLEERTMQLSDLSLIKEAYEKLLEENNTFRMELDTIKYKRNKDREALLEELKKKQDVKIEYEVKLEKIKEKTVQLYREEIKNENKKHQNEKAMYLKKIAQLQSLLDKKGCTDNTRSKDFGSDMESYSSGESFFITPDSSHMQSTRNSFKTTDDLVVSRGRRPDDRKCATLPKTTGMLVIQENHELKRSALSAVPPQLDKNLEMEDEDDELFNNKYLTDLKEGRFVLPSERESNVNRLSELKWRNSLCPPHLKSSYPAETQFNSPSRFKEEDIKSGTVELDDSMSTKLIPGEKPRKKDIGTTSYKRPGPPTPSKNGGRVSLQGNERDVLREHNEAPKTPKRNTPSRLKYLFMGRNTTKDNSENQSGTPRSKRLSIFRKQK